MTDAEIRDRLKALDARDDVDLSSWECRFIEDVTYTFPNRPLSSAQEAKALEILEDHEMDSRSETITKLPPGAERYFRK